MKILLFGMWLTLSGDASTTTYGINHRLVVEALIPSQNVYVIDGILAAEGGGMTAGLLRLNREHPKAAKIIGWSIVAMRAYVVEHNVEQLRKR